MTVHALPNPSLDQRRQALVKANATRAYRAELKRNITAAGLEGRAICAGVVTQDDPPSELRTMKLSDLLRACRGWGPQRIGRVCRRLGIADRATLSSLTDRQRTVLTEELSSGEPRCSMCGTPLLRRSDAKTCSKRCKQRQWRERKVAV